MKKAALTGIVAFTLGAMSAPRAANRNETLDLLCARLERSGTLRLSKEFLREMGGKVPTEGHHLAQWAMHEAIKDSLSAVTFAACGK